MDTAEIERVLNNEALLGRSEVKEDAKDNKKETLLRLAEDGDIDKSVAYMKES